MKVVLLALLIGACYGAPAQPEMSAGFGTVEENPEMVENQTFAVDPSCPPNSSQKKCSSGCPPTCKNPKSTCMVMVCDNRCVCNPGFVLNGDDECILLQACPGYNPDQDIGFNDGQDLDEHSVNREVVEPGMMSEQSEEQINFPDQRECAANQVYSECGSACPKTCANPDGPMFCEQMCVIGCQCQQGYLLTSDKTCVALDDCY
ncbi:zonadhesin-like [Sycon ciliatum]|uniref:zonadhesin-like n=1 Tax=Sycon ciliatum TaxID=27933 RepID=UPI0020ABF4C7